MMVAGSVYERHEHRGGFVGPTILIGLGILLLLSNLGMLQWSVWDTAWRLWPILLIAAGLGRADRPPVSRGLAVSRP